MISSDDIKGIWATIILLAWAINSVIRRIKKCKSSKKTSISLFMD